MSVVEIGDRLVLRQIVKAPQQPSGLTYVGSLTLPFTDCSYVVKVQCEERGTTGVREAILIEQLIILIEQLMAKGIVRSSDGRLEGTQDLDGPRYDDRFPVHPLSRTRRVLALLGQSIVLDQVLQDKPAFRLPL